MGMATTKGMYILLPHDVTAETLRDKFKKGEAALLASDA